MQDRGIVDVMSLGDAGLQTLYAERIEPILRAQEAGRGTAMNTYRMRVVLCVMGAFAVGAITFAIAGDWWNPLFFAGMAFAAGHWWAYQPLKEVATNTKQQSLTAIANAIGCGYASAGFATAALAQFKQLKLLPSCDRSSFEDCFEGKHSGCTFAFYEGHLETRVQSRHGTRWITVFRGQLIRIAFPKKFLGTTIVKRDAGLFNFMQRWMTGLERVGLGDSRLEKAFEVYSNDQVEARYLIHPVFMERLLELETRFKGKDLRCAFVEGDLLVAIEGGDKFEVGTMFARLDDIVRVRTIVADIAGIMHVIDAVLTAEHGALPNEKGPASPGPSS